MPLNFIREHLRDRLRNAIACSAITIISAPAGFGKSALLESLFCLDGKIDKSSARFVRLDHAITGIELLVRRFGEAVGARTYENEDPIALVLDWISRLPSEIIIVVDDLHMIAHEPQALAFFLELVEQTVTTQSIPRKWVFSTRDLEIFPHAVWLSSGHTAIINERNAFALTKQEKSQVRSELRLAPNARVASSLRALNAQFSRLIFMSSISPTCDKSYPTAPASHIKNLSSLLFLLEPELAQTIYALAYLDVLHLERLEIDLPRVEEAFKILESIRLARYDEILQCYVLDIGFKRVLQINLRDQRTEVAILATRIACQNGFQNAAVAAAFNLLIERAEWDGLSKLLGDFGFDLLDREPLHGVISRTIAKMPKELMNTEAALSGLQGAITTRIDFGDVSEAWFRCALMIDPVEPTLRREITYRYGVELARRARPDAIEVLAPLLEESVAIGTLGVGAAARTHSILAAVAMQKKNRADARRHLSEAIDLLSRTFDPYVHARVMHDAAYVMIQLGDHKMAIEMSEESLKVSSAHGFFDLASRTASVRQELAYWYEHDTETALNYLTKMINFASRADEARMALLGWMIKFWLAIESGNEQLAWESKQQIDRSAACDDFMQAQLRQTIVPASAMMKAWHSEFAQAAHLTLQYAHSSPPGATRAYRWSELSIYYAGVYSHNKTEENRRAFLHAFHQARLAINATAGPILQELDIAMRLALSLLLMNRMDGAERLLRLMDNYTKTDKRTPLVQRTLAAMIEYWRGTTTDTTEIRASLAALHKSYLGGLAMLIYAMPFPAAQVRATPPRTQEEEAFFQTLLAAYDIRVVEAAQEEEAERIAALAEADAAQQASALTASP